MKARIKKTGEIVEIAEYSTIYADNHDTCFYPNELEFLDVSDDYWTRLEHQAAIAAMQGILVNYGVVPFPDKAAKDAIEYAHALVEKLKENN